MDHTQENANMAPPELDRSMPSSTGKDPANGPSPSDVGFRPQRKDDVIKVQPPRMEDLQPSYAHQIQHDAESPATRGWYASMSESLSRL